MANMAKSSTSGRNSLPSAFPRDNESATPTITEDTLLPFYLPAVQRRKVTADFAGWSISSHGGLVLVRAAERRLGLAEAPADCIREWREPARIVWTVYTLPPMLQFRMFAIACGYKDANDCDALRCAPIRCSTWRSAERRRAGATSVPTGRARRRASPRLAP